MKVVKTTASILVLCTIGNPAFSDDDLPKTIDHELVGKLVLIPKGEFLMGSTEDELESRPIERPQHKVAIEKPFYMGAYEVTFEQFRRFVSATAYKTDAEKDRRGGSGYDTSKHDIVEQARRFSWRNTGFKQTDNHPVVNVSWNDAVAFCRWLSDKDAKHFYRLPTEAEREYAARAGTTTEYCWGKSPRSLILRENVADRSLSRILSQNSKTKRLCAKWNDQIPFTAPVGSFKPNRFGLYDTHGNVSEWCEDFFVGDRYLKPKNFKSLSGDRRVLRGGSCLHRAGACRVARRFAFRPSERKCFLGFRVVRDVE